MLKELVTTVQYFQKTRLLNVCDIGSQSLIETSGYPIHPLCHWLTSYFPNVSVGTKLYKQFNGLGIKHKCVIIKNKSARLNIQL